MFELANRRLLLASVVCGAITNLLLALLTSLTGSWGLAALLVVMTPMTVLFYAVGLALFGVPLLFLWPSAFNRGVGRGLAAAAIGSATVGAGILVMSLDRGSLPKLRFDFGDPGSVLLLIIGGALAGFVWWWLNFEVAP
jgi:hypothetical protein